MSEGAPGQRPASAGRVTFIIPNWNGAGRLETCLASVFAQRGGAGEVIVVDNASSDGSDLAAEHLGARVIRLAANRGFAAAVNCALAQAASEFVALVNNDVELQPGWLAALLDGMEHLPGCGLVTGITLVRSNPELLDGAGDALSLGFAAIRLGYGRPDGPAYRQEREVLAVSGAASLFRRAVFDRVGGFEEAFFAYLEDMDLCLRARLAGFRAYVVPEAVAWHEGSASTAPPGAAVPLPPTRAAQPALNRRVAAWLTGHQLLLAVRYTRWGNLRAILPRLMFAQALWAARLLRRGLFRAWLRGLGIAAGRWRRLRGWRYSDGAGPARLVELLRASEAQIAADRLPADTTWRVYFRVFPGASTAKFPAVTKAAGNR